MPTTAEAVRRTTLNTVHALRWARLAAVAVCSWLWSALVYATKHKGSKLELIQRDVQRLEKLPIHLALVVNERPVSYGDLARMVNWSFSVGIQYLTLYDPRGHLRSEVETLRRAVEQEHRTLFSAECEPYVVRTSDDLQESPTSKGVQTLLVLGPGDGRELLTGVARSLCKQVQQRLMASGDVDANLINNRLTGSNGGFPEPSLAVVVGSPPSLLGYLPWHTRLTEIVFISSHHKISYQQFHSLLQRYSSTTQRFGK